MVSTSSSISLDRITQTSDGACVGGSDGFRPLGLLLIAPRSRALLGHYKGTNPINTRSVASLNHISTIKHLPQSLSKPPHRCLFNPSTPPFSHDSRSTRMAAAVDFRSLSAMFAAARKKPLDRNFASKFSSPQPAATQNDSPSDTGTRPHILAPPDRLILDIEVHGNPRPVSATVADAFLAELNKPVPATATPAASSAVGPSGASKPVTKAASGPVAAAKAVSAAKAAPASVATSKKSSAGTTTKSTTEKK
ncbi:hypothetical protein BT67DRAFT_9240 [Trichocladium antarcticum]|uniref:Uncharacterized protein n=1 Tax=Trichocladium antarcticum TaxID=1450529 RepID=A0AAN6UV64_9PEZI|nr:hypothetical protein BT67DRAFT_9240 [Trichocladium antarcticum]